MSASLGDAIAAKFQNAKNLLKSGVSSLERANEFESLIRAIGESKSKQEEDRIMVAEIETLKQRLSDPKLDKTRGREYMVRAIYCEMLGHDVSWAQVKALQFASESSIHTKKAAYLAMVQFLDHNSELVLLLVNTLLSDLKSDNFVVVCTALVVTAKLIGPDLINAVLPTVLERLHHPKEQVRKKAVMVLLRFHQLDPRREGPLAGVDIDRHFRTMLCDKDPAVMSAALSALYEAIKVDPKPYKNLIPSFTSILKQVSEHRLPKTYDYHRFPAPFIQIKLLKILAALGRGDRACSENMYTVVQQTLRRANTSHTIGNALIYECVRTITTIYPNPHLLAAAAESIATFLKSSSHNLRYVGIDALAGIVKINSQYAQEHQLAVIDCLEDPDDTLKLKTLELLYKMTKATNVEVITERMMTYLRSTSDEHIKRDIVRKVSELAERYAPSPSWFIGVVSEVFELGGAHVEPQLAHNLMRLIAEQDEDLHRSAVDVYLRLLDKSKLPEILMEVACWVLGEYGALAATSPTRPVPPTAVMNKLVSVVATHKASETVKAYVLAALCKVCCQSGCSLTREAEELVHKSSSSQSVELQQRAYELQALLASSPALRHAALPADGSCEDIDDAELEAVRGLMFLDGYVNDALRSGAAPYVPEDQRMFGRGGAAVNGDKSSLRFAAYEPAAAPAATPSASAGSHTRGRSYGEPSDAGAAASQPSATAGQRPSHSRTPSGGSGAPELQLRAGTGAARKWGPAQFESAPAPSAGASSAGASGRQAPSATGGRTSGTGGGVDLLGGAVEQRAQLQQPSERNKLAASIFGGAGGATSTSTAAGASGPARQPQLQPQHDLLDLTSSPAQTTQPPKPAAAPPKSTLDLLLDLDVPAPAPAATAAGLQGGWGAAPLDLLGGGPVGLGQGAAPLPGVTGLAGMPQLLPLPGGGGLMLPTGFGGAGPATGLGAHGGSALGSGMGIGGYGGGLGGQQGVGLPSMAGLGMPSGMGGAAAAQQQGTWSAASGMPMPLHPMGGLSSGLGSGVGGLPLGTTGARAMEQSASGAQQQRPAAPSPASQDLFKDLL